MLSKKWFVIMTMGVVFGLSSAAYAEESQDIAVSQTSDDAEEDPGGSVGLVSSDLELIRESSDQTVGIRFNGVNIPPGSIVTDAYIQFTCDETRNRNPCDLVIQGQAADNASTFNTSARNISSRNRTAASVNWSPPDWTSEGMAGRDQRTPDLSSIVQEIVNRAGWSQGNSLVVIITGTGRRVAEAYRVGQAVLHLEWGAYDDIATNATEDFETGDFSKFPWEHYGDVTWAISSAEKNSGNYSAKAGSIDDDESTTLQVAIDCVSGNITFYRKVSSERLFDYFKFYIDGVEKDKWSGREDWAEVSFPVTAGTRTFEWTYSKDESASRGDDTAWIDDIVFPIECAPCPLDAPVLHPEPNVTPALHNTISWDSVLGANRYFAECASDENFVNVVANSDWISESSHTFGDLMLGQRYWYRVKAGTVETWLQTSQPEFETDTLIDTRATSDGDVVLAGRGGSAPQVHVIENPSAEVGPAFISPPGWRINSNNPRLWLMTGQFPEDIWVSEGSQVFGVLFDEDNFYAEGDYTNLRQTVDWTGVETLMFDCCGLFASDLTMTVLIGDTEVWSETGTRRPMDIYMDQTVDVSAFSGRHDLKLKVEVNKSGSFLAGVFWDNLRTYGSSGYVSSGKVVSTKIDLPADSYWNVGEFDTTTPVDTELSVDVLPETGSSPIAGYENILSGTDLGGIIDATIRLRANLSSSNPNVTPALHDWSVIHTRASCESDWSNVVSFLQGDSL